jgi:hypothetical protein
MSETIRIGGACAFLGDSATAAPQLIAAGVDYLMLDYLAEVTMSALALAKRANPKAGYARDFTEWVWKENLPAIVARGVKVVTNAGGVNPHGCRARMEEIAAAQGFKVRIAVVEGDDLAAEAERFAEAGTREMFDGRPFPDPKRIASMNAYLGAGPIARALAEGADAVITGRVVDSALALGPLVHAFGWGPGDHDRLASGTLCGHVLECGAQATGGLFTDWRDVPDWAHIGYPIAECAADGTFVVTKPPGSGGLVTPATVCEQMLYEVGDPQAYIVPDVVCDFSGVRMEQVGPDRVHVSGARGYAPTATYKVCATYEDGHRLTTLTPVVGIEAAAKARRQADALLTRAAEMLRDRNMSPFRATRVDVVGAEASYGRDPDQSRAREVLCKIAVEHDEEAPLKVFLREYASPITSMSVGTTMWHGLEPKLAPIVRLFSFLVPKADHPATVDLEGRRIVVPFVQAGVFAPADVERPDAAGAPDLAEPLVEVPLLALAWGRSGDKGDSFNVGIIARRPEFLPWIRAALTPERVARTFAHEFAEGGPARVERFEVPGMNALNFLLHAALGGGGVASMRIDMLAKGKAQQLLETPILVPARIAPEIPAPLRASA